jgi:reactive intermediate/imine deaminase
MASAVTQDAEALVIKQHHSLKNVAFQQGLYEDHDDGLRGPYPVNSTGGYPLPKQCFGTSHVPLSPAVRAGDTVYISGQVPVGSDGVVVKGGITEQTEQVLANVKAALALAGCTMDDVVKTTVWLEDARDFGAFNAVYARHFPKNPPARTTVESRLMIDIKIEVEAVAYHPL